MKRTIISILLIITLTALTTMTSCTKDGEISDAAVILGSILVAGIVIGGWFEDDWDGEDFPPEKYDILKWYGEGKFGGSILSEWDRDWYRTEIMRKGDRITIWSESAIGVRAVLVDEDGRYYRTDNEGPGSNFHIDIEADETTTYYLMVLGHEKISQGPYDLFWRYSY